MNVKLQQATLRKAKLKRAQCQPHVKSTRQICHTQDFAPSGWLQSLLWFKVIKVRGKESEFCHHLVLDACNALHYKTVAAWIFHCTNKGRLRLELQWSPTRSLFYVPPLNESMRVLRARHHTCSNCQGAPNLCKCHHFRWNWVHEESAEWHWRVNAHNSISFLTGKNSCCLLVHFLMCCIFVPSHMAPTVTSTACTLGMCRIFL